MPIQGFDFLQDLRPALFEHYSPRHRETCATPGPEDRRHLVDENPDRVHRIFGKVQKGLGFHLRSSSQNS